MMKNLFVFMIFFCCLSACSNEIPVNPEPKKPSPTNPSEQVSRTVLVYMAADNSLSSFSHTNIQSILEGAKDGNLNGGNLLIYTDPRNKTPYLLQVKEKNGIMITDTIKAYPEQNSASVEVVREVIDFVTQSYPADSYGLDFWSHGSAWLPSDRNLYSRAIGQDGDNWLEISDLKAALPDRLFDFILFDACNMASIEVAYELRDKTNYIIASPTEVMGTGFPYVKIVKDMFSASNSEQLICESFYEFYSASSSEPYGSVSLLKTDALEPLLTITRAVIRQDLDAAVNLPLADVQYCDRLGDKRMLYDIDQYISKLATPEQYIQFQTSLKAAVPYAKNTPSVFFNNGQKIVKLNVPLCGLSIYVMQPRYSQLNEWYQRMGWYKAVYK